MPLEGLPVRSGVDEQFYRGLIGSRSVHGTSNTAAASARTSPSVVTAWISAIAWSRLRSRRVPEVQPSAIDCVCATWICRFVLTATP